MTALMAEPMPQSTSQTTTVRRVLGLAVSLHYLDPADLSVTLCGVPRADTVEHVWPLALATCVTCQQVAAERRVGP